MRFNGLDLNLLVAFNALLDTRSVSRAADRLNLSQPAMSSALSRLRAYFDDPILVSHGKRMYPSAHAEALLPRVRECLQMIETVVATSTRFEPAESHRRFRMVASDYVAAAIVGPLIRRLATIAPRVEIDINITSDKSHDLLEQGKVDLMITPDGYTTPRVPSELLFEERHVVVGWSQNPLMNDALTERAFLDAGHVQVAIGDGQTPAFGDRQCESMGIPRRIEISAASFTMVPWLLQGTQRLSLMHERLARAMQAHFPIAIAPVPFDFPVMREMVQVHSARQGDEGLRWLCDQLRIVANAPIGAIDANPLKQ